MERCAFFNRCPSESLPSCDPQAAALLYTTKFGGSSACVASLPVCLVRWCYGVWSRVRNNGDTPCDVTLHFSSFSSLDEYEDKMGRRFFGVFLSIKCFVFDHILSCFPFRTA